MRPRVRTDICRVQPARFCLISGSSLRTPGAKPSFWGRFAAKRDSQPRVKFGASAGVLTRRTVTRTALTHYSTAREWISLLLRDWQNKTAPSHSRQRGLTRLRRKYPPEFGQQSTIGRFAITETHHLVPRVWSMRRWNACTNNLCPKPFNSARRHVSVMRHADSKSFFFKS